MTDTNFFVPGKFAFGHDGHIPADSLVDRILSHNGATAYHCAFNLEKRQTFKGYQGKVAPAMGFIWFDFDGPTALADVRKFIRFINVHDLIVFFSGSKGFHIGLPESYLPLIHDEMYNRKLGDIACELNKTYPSLDTTVYNAARKFRVPGSKHEKTGLYKIPLDYAQLDNLDLEDMRKIAEIKPILTKKHLVPLTIERKLLPQLEPFINTIKTKSYKTTLSESDGSIVARFEDHPKKLCIKRLETELAPDGHKQNICLRLVTDYKNQRLPIEEARKRLSTWCKINHITDDKPEQTLEQVYAGDSYSFGCNDEYKASRCSGKCDIFKFLTPETRPTVVDAPPALQAESRESLELKRVNEFIESFQGNYIRQGRDDAFFYLDNHWQHCPPDREPFMMKKLMDDRFNFKENKHLESAYKRFVINSPKVPNDIDLLSPDPYRVGFSNGTLHLAPQRDGSYSLTLKPHDRLNYLTHCHKFEYLEEAPLNPEFESAVERVFGLGINPHFEAVRDAYFELLGACLMPGAFRKLAFFFGPPKSGKSTLIKFAAHLVHELYRGSVDPTTFGHRFALQTLVGKLVNIDTDISLSSPLADSLIKKIEDGMPFFVDRKGFTPIQARIPGIHLFGMNKLPETRESVEAYLRRILMFKCDYYQAPESGFDYEYTLRVWEANMQGIVARAIQGLKRLCENKGHFTNAEQNKEIHAAWQEFTMDPVREFIDHVSSGGLVVGDNYLQYKRDNSEEISQTILYDSFKAWFRDLNPSALVPSNRRLFATLRNEKWVFRKSNGMRLVTGVKIIAARDATK